MNGCLGLTGVVRAARRIVRVSASVNARPVSRVTLDRGTSTTQPVNGFRVAFLCRTAQENTARGAPNQISRTVMGLRIGVPSACFSTLRPSNHSCASQSGICQSTASSAVNTLRHRLTVRGAGFLSAT